MIRFDTPATAVKMCLVYDRPPLTIREGPEVRSELVSDSFQHARKHLQLYQENWIRDYHAAMEFWQFQGFLAESARVYEIIRGISRPIRSAIYRGLIAPPPPELAVAEREMFAQWVKAAEWCLPQLARFEKEYGSVDEADVFRAYLGEAKAFVTDWRPQQVARAGGSRVREVTEPQAAKMRTLVNASAPMRVTPRSLPEGDPVGLK